MSSVKRCGWVVNIFEARAWCPIHSFFSIISFGQQFVGILLYIKWILKSMHSQSSNGHSNVQTHPTFNWNWLYFEWNIFLNENFCNRTKLWRESAKTEYCLTIFVWIEWRSTLLVRDTSPQRFNHTKWFFIPFLLTVSHFLLKLLTDWNDLANYLNELW